MDQMKAMRASLPKEESEGQFFSDQPLSQVWQGWGGGGGGGGGGISYRGHQYSRGRGRGGKHYQYGYHLKRENYKPSQQGGNYQNKQCCKHKMAKRFFTPYTEKTNSGHGHGPNYGPTQISWKASLPPEQLAGANKRSVGAKHSSGIQPGLHFRAPPRGTTHTPVLLGTAPADKGKGQSTYPKRGCIGDTAWQPGRVLLKPIPEDGGQRLVINLKPLNQFLQVEHFKMEGIHTLRDNLKPGDWLGKVDLKDATSPSQSTPPTGSI